MTFRTLLFAIFLLILAANKLPSFADTASSEPTESSSAHSTNTKNTIIVHKPAIDPAWGKVIQYQQEQVVSVAERTKEILYRFLFQDTHGMVRSAIYHESPDGTGYWEVTVWDQP
jgi:hypothetical protein